MEPVFDTAVADMVIRGAATPRGLGTLFVEYVGDDLLVLKDDITAELHQSLWSRTPLPFFALVYAWQDVAWGVALQEKQQEILEARSLLNMAMPMEMSRHTAARDNAARVDPVSDVGVLLWATHPIRLQTKLDDNIRNINVNYLFNFAPLSLACL
mmetsp:Transcript_17606/g.26540  ORF Transcript_17606/g.26540 Transcript_17606/m.26540 type:complete len:155 (-) Transcript_17606:115-579(-)